MLELMDSNKVITVNRKAYHDYHILESVEAGLVQTGTEIKSIREGRVSIADAYAKPEKNVLWLYNSHIAAYQPGSRNNHEVDRPRKLLLHKRQLADMTAAANQKGLPLVPLKLYIKKGVAKIEIGLGRGKKLHDKRASIARRENEREIERALKRN